MLKLTRYVLYDILRSKVVIAYTLFLLITSLCFFTLEDNHDKAMLSLLSIVLLVVPLISMIFTTIHYYNSYEFIELMLSQPLSRTRILLSEYSGVLLSLLTAYGIGVGIPIILFAWDGTGLALLFTGALLLWFYFSLIYDGLVLMILFGFSDYPMEKFTLLLSALNPVDLGRIFIMLQMDVSALMGYTGALYKEFFGSALGVFFTIGIMCIWAVVPLLLAFRRFRRKDM
jgi:Cu-processing system permease protein